jgi:hypothetical protein
MKKADNFNPGKWLVENKITTQSRLSENVSNDVEAYLSENFTIYLEGGDTFEEDPGELHTFTMEADEFGDPENYDDSDMFFKAVKQLDKSPIMLKYDKDYIGDYGKVNVKSDGTDIFISFIVPEDADNLSSFNNPTTPELSPNLVDKIKDSTNKLKDWVKNTLKSNNITPDKRGWLVLKLNINDISDITFMDGNNISIQPSSEYESISLRFIPEDNDVDILLWDGNGTKDIFPTSILGNQFANGILSLKYKGELIGNNFENDIN